MITISNSLTTPNINTATDTLFYQLMSVMGLKKPGWITRILYPFFRPPARQMAKLLVDLDLNIAQIGWNSAVSKFRENFVSGVQTTGADGIPQQGPLVVMSNHPAAFDIVILVEAIKRDDLMIIASDIRIFDLFPNISRHIIPVPYNIPQRLNTVRSTIKHLHNGGAIFIFPRGNVEPDPTVSPGAEESMDGWSPSIELFLRKVPDTRTIVAVCSGMLSARWFYNPIIRRWKKYEQRQKVAEIFQIAAQIVTRKKPAISPRVSFSGALTVEELGGVNSPEGTLLTSIIHQARSLLVYHPHI